MVNPPSADRRMGFDNFPFNIAPARNVMKELILLLIIVGSLVIGLVIGAHLRNKRKD